MVTLLKILCVGNIILNLVSLGISIGEGEFDSGRLSATLGWGCALLNLGIENEN